MPASKNVIFTSQEPGGGPLRAVEVTVSYTTAGAFGHMVVGGNGKIKNRCDLHDLCPSFAKGTVIQIEGNQDNIVRFKMV